MSGRGPTCPLTGRPTLPVSRITVLQHVAGSAVPETGFGFCDRPSCTVVYVGESGRLIAKDELRTRVGLKETVEPIPVCYCWSFTERQIVEDVREHGESTIRSYIQEQVRAGRCACEVKNPAGRCCLGAVSRAITRARRPAR
jgi:hypothetical protein